MENDSDSIRKLKSAPFHDDLSYTHIQDILLRFLNAQGAWQQSLQMKHAPSSNQLREFLNTLRETGQALKLNESSASHVALQIQLARLARIDVEMNEGSLPSNEGDVFLSRLDWPDLYSAVDAAFELILKIIFEQATRSSA